MGKDLRTIGDCETLMGNARSGNARFRLALLGVAVTIIGALVCSGVAYAFTHSQRDGDQDTEIAAFKERAAAFRHRLDRFDVKQDRMEVKIDKVLERLPRAP